jgi:branched-chain amino acid transport system ATP-binding protein
LRREIDVTLLETTDVTVRFGGNIALRDVSIGVQPGTVTGLIGPNGAGKTTLFNVITGLLRPQGGRVLLNDEDITRLPPYKRARRGLSRTFQRLELFTSLDVRDNVRVAGQIRNAARVSDRVDVNARADEIIELVGLSSVAHRDITELPTGTARRVELARSLMARPQVVLLDEPASGQTEKETEEFGVLLKRLTEMDGLAICLVEHDMSLVMQVCSTIHVLDYGRVIAVGTPDEIRSDQAVIDAYLGTTEGAA